MFARRLVERFLLEVVLQRDGVIVFAALVAVTIFAWVYLLQMNGQVVGIDVSDEMVMPVGRTWSAVDFTTQFFMWVVMMVAMMLPSASPFILMVAAVNRKRREFYGPLIPTGFFVLGYFLTWAAFSLVATVAQWALHSTALLSPDIASASPLLGGLFLLVAGFFQFTELKRVCLKHCRSPLGFLMRRWREGRKGALCMGIEHGLYCVGCCWALMMLMFVAGVMNLLWFAVISLLVFGEKALLHGEVVRRIGGTALLVAGGALLALVL